MSVDATITALQALNATITGVTWAPDKYPRSIPSSQLPVVLVLPGEGSWDGTQNVGRRQFRTYRHMVYVQPVSQDLTTKTLETVRKLLQAFGEAYTDVDNIILTTTDTSKTVSVISNPQDITDTGLASLEFAGNLYHGFEFRTRIFEKWSN